MLERLSAGGLPTRVGSRAANPAFDWQDRATWAPALDGVGSVYISYYLVGAIGMTVAFTVPRNNALTSVEPADSDAAERWRHYDASWTAGNHVRTIACLAAATLLLVATRVG